MDAFNSIQYPHVSPGYDVQSASTRAGELYITGAPRYNHTGRVFIYRLNEENKIVVSQILKGEQVSLHRLSGVWTERYLSLICVKSCKMMLHGAVHIFFCLR